MLCGRVPAGAYISAAGSLLDGACLYATELAATTALFELCAGNTLLANATKTGFSLREWHDYSLVLEGTAFTAKADGAVLAATALGAGHARGRLALGTGFHRAEFDALRVGGAGRGRGTSGPGHI